MAQHRASHDRLASLTASSDAPDPEFWGSEPHAVRRTRRAAPDEPRPTRPAWWTSLLDRARDARVEVGIGVVVVALVAAVAGVVWYWMGAAGGGAPTPSATPARPAATAPPANATEAASTTRTAAGRGGPSVVVHVAGAVTRPGVLVMPAGARVIDAVEGAGGALPDADLDRINLAAELVDGQRILVAKVGAVAVADPAVPGAPGIGAEGALIDLNSATALQLETLPGIGPALAGAIVAERDRRGGFRSVNELREVRGIGDARFADLRDRVTV